MSQPFYHTPANVKDLSKQSDYQVWSDTIDNMVQVSLVGDIPDGIPPLGTKWYKQIQFPQWYDAQTTKTTDPNATQTITWNGYPKYLSQLGKQGLVLGDQVINMTNWNTHHWDAPYNPSLPGEVCRRTDEYLEWFVTRNSQGKITRVDFTCEGPEYWQFLFQQEPNTLLKLYHQYVSPSVQLNDLTDTHGNYDPNNKWNTLYGVAHLNCPPNSLFAEVYLAASATVIRKDKNGNIITDAQQLCNCARYGVATRNSDPTIGSAVNTLAREGYRVTLQNPVGLYIDHVVTNSLQKPDGSPLLPASRYVKCTRGDPSKKEGLRYTFEVPDDGVDHFVLGDCLLAGVKIEYGGQLASLITMNLSGLACKAEHGVQPPVPCESVLLNKSLISLNHSHGQGIRHLGRS